MELEKRQYPIGKFKPKNKYSEKEIAKNIGIIATYPAKYKRLVKKLSDADLEKTYREGAWNIRQLVVHLADMHILHFARFKQALCIENPVGYVAEINAWAEMPEVNDVPVSDALALFDATHKRWVHLLKATKTEEFDRTFFHPLRNANLTLAQALAMSAWHSKHHFEHIKIALEG